MTMPLVIYHANCWDGFCAAWVARMALGEVEAFPAYYGSSPPKCHGRNVFVLDFCYPRDAMLRMFREAVTVVVLDHHKTAQAALDGIVEEYIGSALNQADPTDNVPTIVFDMDKSGGRLAWEHFAYVGGWLGMNSPWLVDYTEDRDLWRHQLEDSRAVNAALRSYPLEFKLWDGFAKQHPTDFTREGEAIRRAERAIMETHIKNARMRDVGGTIVPVVNATVLFSEIAGELAKGQPFAACYFDRQDGKRQWSLRSTDEGVDVSAIAKAHGGGGHMRAAGFEETL